MKNEAEFNGIVTKSLNMRGWGYKIADQVSLTTGMTSPKPFDAIGIYKSEDGEAYPVYLESKFMKKPGAFNFNKLEDQQIAHLLKCQRLLGNKAIVLFLICVDCGRADKRVYYFKNMEYVNKRKEDKRSFLQKEMLKANNYTVIKNGLINFEDILKGESYEI